MCVDERISGSLRNHKSVSIFDGWPSSMSEVWYYRLRPDQGDGWQCPWTQGAETSRTLGGCHSLAVLAIPTPNSNGHGPFDLRHWYVTKYTYIIYRVVLFCLYLSIVILYINLYLFICLSLYIYIIYTLYIYDIYICLYILNINFSRASTLDCSEHLQPDEVFIETCKMVRSRWLAKWYVGLKMFEIVLTKS